MSPVGQPRDDSACRSFGRVEESARQQQVVRARDAEVLDEARAVLDRQSVAERARDRHAELRGRRAHAEVARERNAQPPPAAMPSTCAIVGTLTRSSRATHASRRRSYSRPSSRDENPVNWLMSVPVQNVAAVARIDERRADRRVGVDAVAGLDERVVHRPRHRVARRPDD